MERIEVKNTKNLVFFLHGYGTNGADLLSLGHRWQPHMPDVTFVAPNAPEEVSGSSRYQWFDPQQKSQDYTPSIKKACNFIHTLIEKEMKRYALKKEQIILVGFSQGAFLSLLFNYVFDYGPVGGVIAYSGGILPNVEVKNIHKGTTPLLLIHGEEDQLITLKDVLECVVKLKSAGVSFEFHRFAGLAHSISDEGQALGQKFLQARCTQRA